MNAARPRIPRAFVVLTVVAAIGAVPRLTAPPEVADARALPRARLELRRSQLVALEAHALLLDQRIAGALSDLEFAAFMSSEQFRPKIGFGCEGLSCFD